MSDRLNTHYSRQNVLVTGGCGFVGGHVARKLLQFGAHVTVLDIDTDKPSLAKDELTHQYPDSLSIEKADIRDREAMERIIGTGQFQFIFHFAAYAAVVQRAFTHPYEAFQSNTAGFFNILDVVRSLPRNLPTVFFASTDKVYGEMQEGEDAYVEDKTPLRGIGIYDSTKLAADVFARAYKEVYGIRTIVLRMCNLFGEWDLNFDYRLLPRAMRSIFGFEPPKPPELYYDSMAHEREYLYVNDAVNVILELAYRPQCMEGVCYNLPGVEYTNTPAMLKTIVDRAAHVEMHVFHKPDRAAQILQNGLTIAVQPGSKGVIAIRKQRLNGAKLCAVLDEIVHGYTPFDDALDETIKWYRGYLAPSRI